MVVVHHARGRRGLVATAICRQDFRCGTPRFLRTSVSALTAAPALALGFGIITRKDLTIHEVSMKFPNLPKDLQGLRLVQLSDIHMGVFYRACRLGARRRCRQRPAR